jgi:hypothetical protein
MYQRGSGLCESPAVSHLESGKGKGKFRLITDHDAQRRSKGIALLFL